MSRDIYDILGTRSLVIDVRGIEIMNDDPSSANVVYMKVAAPALQHLVDTISNRMTDDTLHIPEAREEFSPSVKLHATLINTKYGTRGKRTINATKLLSKYADFNFGSCKINQIRLCERSGVDRTCVMMMF